MAETGVNTDQSRRLGNNPADFLEAPAPGQIRIEWISGTNHRRESDFNDMSTSGEKVFCQSIPFRGRPLTCPSLRSTVKNNVFRRQFRSGNRGVEVENRRIIRHSQTGSLRKLRQKTARGTIRLRLRSPGGVRVAEVELIGNCPFRELRFPRQILFLATHGDHFVDEWSKFKQLPVRFAGVPAEFPVRIPFMQIAEGGFHRHNVPHAAQQADGQKRSVIHALFPQLSCLIQIFIIIHGKNFFSIGNRNFSVL